MKPEKPRARDIVIVTVVSLAPVVIALLIQKPALRQAIAMRFFHYSKMTCQNSARILGELGIKAESAYQKASL